MQASPTPPTFLKTSTTSGLGLALGASALSAQDGSGATPLVVTNAKVLTVDEQDRTAEAFIIEGGKFTYVGSTQEALEKQPAGAQVIDAQGASASQLSEVSYGEERPSNNCSEERCWSQNRRVEVVSTSQQ